MKLVWLVSWVFRTRYKQCDHYNYDRKNKIQSRSLNPINLTFWIYKCINIDVSLHQIYKAAYSGLSNSFRVTFIYKSDFFPRLLPYLILLKGL